MQIKDVVEDQEPQNLLYVLTKDNFDLWRVLFPQFDPLTKEVINSKWHIDIGCDSNESVSHGFCEDLARALAKYVTMIDFWLGRLNSTSKME
jgi:hypothetical protein